MTIASPPRPVRTVRDPAAFLRVVPRLAECTPRNSLVLVPFAGRVALGALRLDLPCAEPDPPPHGDRALRAAIDNLAATAVGMVCRLAEADGFAVVAYDSREPWPPDGPLPQEPLVDRVLDCAEVCGLGVLGAYLVAQDGWGAYGDIAAPAALSQIVPEASAALAHDQHDGCALPGTTASERAAVAERLLADESGFALWLAVRRAPDDAREDGTASASPVPPGPGRAAIDADGAAADAGGAATASNADDADAVSDAGGADAAALAGGAANRTIGNGRRSAGLDGAAGDELLRDFDALPEQFERALAWNPSRLDPADAARLALVFEMPIARDTMLTQWASDIEAGRECLAWQLAWRRGRKVDLDDVPSPVMRLAGDGPRPEPWRLRQGLELARRIAAVGPPRVQAGALASAAWLSWALGRSTHAAHYVEAALERESEHGFARLMEELIVASRLPSWAFRPDDAAISAT